MGEDGSKKLVFNNKLLDLWTDLTLLWHSNAPWSPTGYGNQTMINTPRIAAAGWKLLISAFYGLAGHILEWQDGIRVLPGVKHPYGADIIDGHAYRWEADMVLTLLDVWVLPLNKMARLPWAAWCPVDHEPIPPLVKEFLKVCRWPLAMSRFGETQMKKVGLENVHYIPHGVESSIFQPGNRAEARRELAETIIHEQHEQKGLLTEDTFLVAMVAANKGDPSRKAFNEVLVAWKLFHDLHPESHLYLHTEVNPQELGVDLRGVMEILQVPETSISFPPGYDYRVGGIGPGYLNKVYNAADVFLNPAWGEGFGIPIVEAQMAGCPVIVGDNTSQRELCLSGWTVKGAPFITPMKSFQFRPIEAEIVAALEKAQGMEQAERERMRQEAREKALAYDADTVFLKHWLPFLTAAATEIRRTKDVVQTVKSGNGDGERESLEEKREKRAERYRADRQRWSATGIYNPDGSFSVPSLDNDDELLIRSYSDREIIPDGFKPVVNGVDLGQIEDAEEGAVKKIVARELQRDCYGLERFIFGPAGRVVDIGAHVGVVSIYLALRHPHLGRIDAYEPHPENFQRLVENVGRYRLEGRIFPHNLAVTGDGRTVQMHEDKHNSGGHNIVAEDGDFQAESVAFKTLLEEPVTFLKMDCEGAEYEIFSSVTREDLAAVTAIGAEFHWQEGKPSPEELKKQLEEWGVQVKATFTGKPMECPTLAEWAANGETGKDGQGDDEPVPDDGEREEGAAVHKVPGVEGGEPV